MWTRRRLNSALLAGASLPFLPLGAEAERDWAQALRAALQSRLESGQGAFALTGFEHRETGAGVTMRARVALDWPPGRRARVIEADGPDGPQAYARLEARAQHAFAMCFGAQA